MTEIDKMQQLLSVAEIIARAKKHPAEVSKAQAIKFSNLVRDGFVEIDDDRIAFATPELIKSWLSRYCAMCISDVWENFDQTAHELIQSYRLFHALGMSKHVITQLFLSLKNDYGMDILVRLEEIAHSCVSDRTHEVDFHLNSIYFKFCDVLPELDYTPADLADHLGPVLEATKNYSRSGMLHGAIERMAGQSQAKAEALLDAFLQHSEQGTVELAANSLKSLWKFDTSKAQGKALGLTKAEFGSLQRIGAIALAWFEYELPLHERELLKTIDRLDQLCESNDMKVLTAVTQAFGDLMVVLPQCSQLQQVRKQFFHLASYKKPDVQSVIAQTLSKYLNNFEDADFLWATLNYLACVPAQFRGILRELDLITYRMVNRNPKRVAEYLEDVVTSRLYRAECEHDRLQDLYGDSVDCLADKHQSVFESTITRWFGSIDSRLHAAAADLVGYFAQKLLPQKNRTIQLDSVVLNSLDEGDVQRIICALTGYVDDHKALALLLISILSREIVSERVRELIVNALDQVVLYNMPDLADECLKPLTEETDISKCIQQVVTDALNLSDSYYKQLRKRPYLKELIPPDLHVHRFSVKFSKLRSSPQDRGFSESSLLDQIPRIPVKYGQSVSASNHMNVESFAPMQTFYTDVSIPREEILDPMGYRIKRMNWRRMAVEGLPVETPSPHADQSPEAIDEKNMERK